MSTCCCGVLRAQFVCYDYECCCHDTLLQVVCCTHSLCVMTVSVTVTSTRCCGVLHALFRVITVSAFIMTTCCWWCVACTVCVLRLLVLLHDILLLVMLQLCCVEEDTEKMVQSIGPIHPDSCEAEFKHLKKGSYTVYLETHVSAPASCLPAASLAQRSVSRWLVSQVL